MALALALALASAPFGAVARADDDLAKGIALVDDGDYGAAILVLDTATTQPADSRNRLEFTGRLPNAQGGGYDTWTVVATRPGPIEARATVGQIELLLRSLFP